MGRLEGKVALISGGARGQGAAEARAFVEEGIQARRREITSVQKIIDTELDRYVDESTARSVAPLVAGLRDRAAEVTENEFARFSSKLEKLDEDQRKIVEGLVSGVVGKLLHEPTVRMKDAAGTARGERLAEALRDLFNL